ncbi:hypothetical protein [Ferruginibacter albus]|uniref:hypothetical protein n=1 Tax=Ferruginibacter albus TaxID=2875540 RepID=UPI001CC79C16|nr:hypothetical protein [Ferruginibacter albus]UAY52778.1 hypothetical protein K9M53_03600 [Ferruginibacter albus]
MVYCIWVITFKQYRFQIVTILTINIRPMNFEIIKFNKESNNYTIIEAGYRYEIPSCLYDNLKTFLLQYDLVSRWYKHLNDNDREKVNRVSAYG